MSRWSETLPSMRKRGGYGNGKKNSSKTCSLSCARVPFVSLPPVRPSLLPAPPERRVRHAPRLPAPPAARADLLQLHDVERDAFSDYNATARHRAPAHPRYNTQQALPFLHARTLTASRCWTPAPIVHPEYYGQHLPRLQHSPRPFLVVHAAFFASSRTPGVLSEEPSSPLHACARCIPNATHSTIAYPSPATASPHRAWGIRCLPECTRPAAYLRAFRSDSAPTCAILGVGDVGTRRVHSTQPSPSPWCIFAFARESQQAAPTDPNPASSPRVASVGKIPN
ncbi:hypothetical protein B0H13DRAFT_2353509 [Mycena leptocephala]|nr:hypothetical protein B0H13DRAFT_2353509 [Mycena leptocephala]